MPVALVRAEPAKVSFVRDVAPILVRHCSACHGPKKAEGGYLVDTFAHARQPGDSESAPFTAGDLEDSELYRLIASEDADERMPKEGDPLAAEQVALIKRWIDQGAEFDGLDVKATLASIIPRAPHPDPPEVYRAPIPVTALAFSPDGSELVVGGYHELTVWNATDGKLLRRVKNLDERTYALRFSKDGAMLAVGGGAPGQGGEVTVLHAADGSELKFLGTTTDVIFGVAFRPDGKKLAAAGADRAIHIYDVDSGKEERRIEHHADWVMAVDWSADGKLIASASRDKTAKVFDPETGALLMTYSGHGKPVYGVAIRPDSKQVYSAGEDQKIHLWNVVTSAPGETGKFNKDRKAIAQLSAFSGEIYRLAIAGGRLYGCAADKTAREYNDQDRKQLRVYSDHSDWVFALAAHAGTGRLATGSYDGHVKIWNTADGEPVVSFIAAPGSSPPAP